MSVTDFHPEALLERDASGTLDGCDRARLERHLEGCETCRFERTVRRDFSQELADSDCSPKPARLGAVLAKAKVLAPGAGYSSARARFCARLSWLVAASIVCGAGAAMGAGLASRVFSRFEGTPTPHARAAGAPEAARSSPMIRGPMQMEQDSPSDGASALAPEVHPTPAVEETRDVRDKRATAAALFDAESDARRRTDYVQALAFHRELTTRFRPSAEAQVSRAVMGRGLLDRGRAEEALACFDDYLAVGSGNLGEEVMAGRATALERLGRVDDARGAWRRLLERYPATSYVSRATALLEKPL